MRRVTAHIPIDNARRVALARWFVFARRRRWSASVVLSAIVLGAAGGLIGPYSILAGGSHESTGVMDPARRQFVSQLGELVTSSKAVLLMNERRDGSFVDLVLWRRDDRDPGRINPDEILVLSHSRILQTITLYRFDQRVGSIRNETRVTIGEDLAVFPPDHVVPATLRQPDFCDRWRTSARVNSAVLATDVRELAFDTPHNSSEVDAKLRISLTWSSDSVDTPDSATTVVAATWRSLPVKE